MTVSYRLSSVAVAALLAAGLPALDAKAADLNGNLGGDCCADLEARVAQLEATTARKGNKKVSLTVSGRVNATVMWWRDNSAGTDNDEAHDSKSDVYFGNSAVDTTHPVPQGEGTRITFAGDGKISADATAGFRMTIGNDFGGANTQFSYQTGSVLAPDTTYVFLKSKTWGEYRLGNLPSASDDAYYIDFGAPGTVGGLAGTRFLGTFHLRATNQPGELTDVTYGHVLGELNDLNDNRLMYISPTWNGFAYKSDVGNKTGSVALTWSGSSGTLHGAAGAGYEVSRGHTGANLGNASFVPAASSAFSPLTDSSNDTLRQAVVSASVMESNSGLFLTGEWSRAYAAISGRDDAVNWYARTGWVKNVTGLGNTVIDAQYERTDNKLANGTSAHLWGLGIDQAIDSVASNIYLHYQHDSFDTSGAVTTASSSSSTTECADGSPICTVDAQSIDSLTAGMVIAF